MLLRGDVISAMKSGLFPKTKSTPAAASKMSAPSKRHQLLAQHQVMKILPPARFRRYGIDESVVEIPVNRVFLEYNLCTCLQMVKRLQLICDGNSWIKCSSDHSKVTGRIQVRYTTCLSWSRAAAASCLWISCLKWFLVSKLQVLLLATSSMIGCWPVYTHKEIRVQSPLHSLFVMMC